MRKLSLSNSYPLFSYFLLLSALLWTCQNDPQSSSSEDETDEAVNLVPLQEEYDKSNVKWGFIDKSGKVVIEGSFEEVSNFSEGLAAYRDKATWGYIDKKGEVAVEPSYYNAFSFIDGLAKVSNFERKYGCLLYTSPSPRD